MPRRRITLVLSAIALVVLLAVVGYGLYLGNMAGMLPWQGEVTRVPVTPFANLPGRDDAAGEGEEAEGTPATDATDWRLSPFAVVPAARG